MPERKPIPDQMSFPGGPAYYAKEFDKAVAWNDALDEFARLNPSAQISTYTTRAGESLMGIALRQLKDESRWPEIRDLNADEFPDMGPHDYYPAGTVLKMPNPSAQGEKP
ncbi:hypothetical protein D3C78_1591530 [compost metagenome]